MLPGGALVFPALLVAIYGIYRVGRDRESPTFTWVRVCTLAVMLGVMMAVQVRMVASGETSPWNLMAGSLAIAAVFGMVGVNLLRIFEARSGKRREAVPAAQS